jgi:hypothetical protein
MKELFANAHGVDGASTSRSQSAECSRKLVNTRAAFHGWACAAAALLLLFLAPCGYAQMRECVTSHNRITRISLGQAVREMLDMDADYSYAMQDYAFVVFARITHRARALSDLSRATISMWTRAARNGERLSFSQNEVEVACGGQKYWFPMYKQYIGDILNTTRMGEGLYLYVWALGARENTPVFFIVNYGTINEWGSHDEVLEDAVEVATTLRAPEEALAIVTEMETQWSGEEWWREADTKLAVRYVKGIAHMGLGHKTEAEPFLQEVREYIAQNPTDDFTQTMLPALVRLAFKQGMPRQACSDAMRIESPDDDIEEAYCDTCLSRVLHAAELGKNLASLTEAKTAPYDALLDHGPGHASYAAHGLQVMLHADPATGVVKEKRVLIRSVNEDALDWMESVTEDFLEELAEENESVAEEEGQDGSPERTRVDMVRREVDDGELLEVVFH